MTPEVERKRRELFEEWLSREWPDGSLKRYEGDMGRYTDPNVEDLWIGWSSALDTVEIELPQDRGLCSYEDFCATRSKCAKAIESTGLGLRIK